MFQILRRTSRLICITDNLIDSGNDLVFALDNSNIFKWWHNILHEAHLSERLYENQFEFSVFGFSQGSGMQKVSR